MPKKLPLRSLFVAAAALSACPFAAASTVQLFDNSDLARSKTVTVTSNPAQPSDGTSVTPHIYAPSDTTWATGTGTGFAAPSPSTEFAGTTTTTTTYSSNSAVTLTGAAITLTGDIRDFATPAISDAQHGAFSSINSLSQALGQYSPGAILTTRREYDTFGLYTNAPVTPGYYIDANDYSGSGVMRWNRITSVAVIAGNNTYIGDTFIAGTAIVTGTLGTGTATISDGSNLVFNRSVSGTVNYTTGFSGSGNLVFAGDTSIGGGSQTSVITSENPNFTGSIRIDSGIAGARLNTLTFGDGSTTGATSNVGSLGSASIEIGRADKDRPSPGATDGTQAYSSLNAGSGVTSRLAFNLSGSKTLTNGIRMHAMSSIENIGGGDITLVGRITTGVGDTTAIRNVSGSLHLAGGIAQDSFAAMSLTNLSSGELAVSGTMSGPEWNVANLGTGDIAFKGPISGLFFLNQAGSGTTTLGSANDISGVISIGNAGTVEFTADGALGTGSLNLAGGTLRYSGTTPSTFSNSVTLTSSSTFDAAGDAIFSGVFVSPAGATLTKIGASDLILSGDNNSFQGNFVVDGGRLVAGNGGTTGNFGLNGITLTNGGSVAVNRTNTVTVNNNISGAGGFEQIGFGTTILAGNNTYTGVTKISAGTLEIHENNLVASGLAIGGGDIENNGVLKLNSGGTAALTQTISGTGAVIFTGGGSTEVLANNTYTGLTTVASGSSIQVGNGGAAGSLGTGAIVNDGYIQLNLAGDTVVSNHFTGSGVIEKVGTDALTFADYASGVSVTSGGQLTLTNGGTLGAISVGNGGTINATSISNLTVNGGELAVTANVSGNVSVAAPATVTLGTDRMAGSSLTASGVAVNGTLTLVGSDNHTVDEYSGAGSIEMKSDGILSLTDSASNFSGTLAFDAGLTKFAKASDLDAGTLRFGGGTVFFTSSAALTLNQSIQAVGGTLSFIQLAGDLTVNGDTSLVGSGQAAIRKIGPGALTVNGAVDANVQWVTNSFDLLGTNYAASNFVHDPASPLDITNSSLTPATLTVTQSIDGTAPGQLSGNLSLVKNGAATLTLAGTNTYTNGTTINEGTIAFDGNLSFGTGDITLNGGSLEAVGARTIANTVAVTASSTVTGADSLTLNGALNGTGDLIKTGTGTLTLAAAGTYAGNAFVNQGTLALANDAALGTGTLTLNGGSLAANGNRTVANTVAVTASSTVTGADSLTLNGALNGTGNLIKTGTGTLTLAATGAYTGNATVTEGTLALANDAALGTGTLTLNGGSLAASGNRTIANTVAVTASSTVTGADSLTLNGALNGTGDLIKTGTGTLTLAATGAYTGNATVTGGTLALANDAALGTGTLTLNGGSLAASGNRTVANAVTVASAASISGSDSLTLAAGLAGSGALTKDGSGMLTLAATGAYTGNAIVTGGTLALGDDAALGTGTLALNGGALAANGNRTVANSVTVAAASSITGSDTLTLIGAVTGSAVLTKSGSGTLEMTDASAYTGTLTISEGTVLLSNGLTGGEVAVNNGTLNIVGANTVSHDISGLGKVVLSGSGVTTLGTGLTHQGELIVQADHALDLGTTQAHLVQSTIARVMENGTLRGQGTIAGAVLNAGVVSPGNSPGIITLGGDYVQTATGVLNIEIAGNGSAGTANGFDQIRYAGTARIAGGTLNIAFLNGFTPANNASYQILLDTDPSTPAWTGQFDRINLPSGTLSFIRPNASGLVYYSYDSFAALPGYGSVNGIGGFDAMLSANPTSAETRALLDAYANGNGSANDLANASPIAFGSMTALQVDEARGTSEIIRNRLDAARHIGKSTAQKLPWSGYIAGTGSFGSSDIATFDQSYYGAKGGAERIYAPGSAVGGNLGYDKGKAKISNGGGDITQSHLSASIYASQKFDNGLFAYYGAFAGVSSFDTDRNTVLGSASGNTSGWDIGLTAYAGKSFRVADPFELTPYAGATLTRAQVSGFGESGTGFASSVSSYNQLSLRIKLGTDSDWKLPVAGADLRLGMGLAWEHECLDENADITARLRSGTGGEFTVHSATLPTNSLNVGPHISCSFGEWETVRLGYEFQYGFGDGNAQRIDLSYTKRF